MLDSSVWISVGNESPAPEFQHSWDESQRTYRSGRTILEPSSETKLVKDSLHALQGIGAAVTRLREHAAAFKFQAADKTVHNISTLWNLASSTNALAKLLAEVAVAGSYRCQLDQFVEFFLSSQHVGAVKPQEAGSSRSRRRSRKQEARKDDDKKVSPGLLNQAFAAAIRTILQGHSASLDALSGSLSRRRCDNEPVSDRYGGALFGFGHGFVSLLELYLHTAELRMQLQALAHVCLLDNSEGSAEATCMSRLQTFPQGAELLTHLYNLLLEPDPLHSELLRFLFSRTLDPYMLFIRTCIYCANLEDPHGEFILEKLCSEDGSGQSTLKVRSGVCTPVFLVQACTQILRAAQQLEVLLRLPETRDFALAFSSRVHNRKFTTIDETLGSESAEKFDKANFEEKRVADSEDSDRLELEGEGDSKSDSDDGIALLEDGTHILESSETRFEGPKAACRIQQFSKEYKVDEGLEEMSFFLSGYNKSASWLDVGLPRNPFTGGDTRVYGYIYTLFLDRDDGWEIRSSVLNEDSLLKQLLPELSQVGLLTLPKSTKNKKGDVDLVSVLLNDDNLPAITGRMSDSENDNASEPVLERVSCDQENVVNNKGPAQGGGRWETSLKLVQKTLAQENYHDELEMSESDAPVSVVVETTIVGEIRKQYRLVSDFTVKVLQENLHLREHYMALRRYYFIEVGDWADNFVTALCSHKWGPSGCQHHLVEAQGMLEAALQKSSCDGDAYAERLQVRRCCSQDITVPEFVNHNRLEAFDFIELEYNIEWPLDMVLTSAAFWLYKQVFRLLLRVRHAVFALREISKTLQAMERPSRKFSSQNSDQKNRFRALQLFRHQIGHFVTAFQSHIQSQLLHVIWSDFLHAIKHEIKDMQDLEIVHHKYLNNAVQRCFLSPEQEGVKHCMDNIMQCLLDFRSILRSLGGEQGGLCSDVLYSKVLGLRAYFGENMRLLQRYHLRPELSEFWTALDFNGYFVSTC